MTTKKKRLIGAASVFGVSILSIFADDIGIADTNIVEALALLFSGFG